MKYLILFTLFLSGCAGLTCNDSQQVGMFDDCTGHKGTNLQASFPGTEVDTVEALALTAFNKFYKSSYIKPLDERAPTFTFNRENCIEHVRWIEAKLATKGTGGDMIVSETEFAYHAAFLTEDGRVIDINHKEPLSLGEWLAFTNRI